ncbi:alpha/beta hydrolase [Corynebacterium suranareeae]|uniref:Alpha/beta hydrolase n=1 Tax=Corynebacterium suranareeae TaxID=2506452 RepID=A0A160PQ90_9CORY|nr:alpha/beta hydrolase [Corynebacterium suranareeae]BAU94380.1 alpha/beta hydrolase [Corynebacterium suranareeae]
MAALIRGSGPHHVLVLNGWFGHAADWGPFGTYLDEDKYTWHFWDYRGYGSRKDESGEFSLEEIADDIVAYISTIEAEKLSLLGHSMGGVYMQKVLAQSPVPIVSLVGISPVPAAGTPFDEDSRKLFTSAGQDPQSRRAIIDFTSGSSQPDAWLDELTKSTEENSTPEAVEKYFYAWADCDFADELGSQTLPVYVITGALDPAVTKSVVESTFSPIYNNLTVEELPDVGHYSIFEHPLGLTSRVLRFLDSV